MNNETMRMMLDYELLSGEIKDGGFLYEFKKSSAWQIQVCESFGIHYSKLKTDKPMIILKPIHHDYKLIAGQILVSEMIQTGITD